MLEGGGDDDAALEKRSKRLVPISIGVAVVALIIIGIRVFHHEAPPKPPPEVAEAPKPPPPPPPKPLSAEQIFRNAAPAVGQVMSYEMSGRAVPIGLAVSVEPGAFVTTCHGVPAGSQLVVKTGAESRSATLTITDEQLDLCKLAIAADDPKAGDKVYALGANAKGELALTEGTIKSIRPGGKPMELSFPIAKNGSGGAVFDPFGRVVGVATEGGVIPAASISQMRTRGK